MKKILPITIALVLALVSCELILKIFFPSPWVNGYSPSIITGTRLTPKSSGVWNQEGFSNVSVNSVGYNDDEHNLTKPQKTYRIAVIGDSYVESLQVVRAKTFWKTMEKMLNRNCATNGYNFEVLAFGVSGWGPSQEFFAATKIAKRYNPDLYIFHITTGNDIRNQSRALELDPNRPYFVRNDGTWQWDLSFRNLPYQKSAVDTSILSKLEIYKWSRVFLRLIKSNYFIKSQEKPSNQEKIAKVKNSEVGLDNNVYLPYSKLDEQWKFAWDSTLKVYEQMANIIGKKKIIFEIGSNGVQVYPDYSVKLEFAKSLGVQDLYEPNRFLHDFFKSRGLDYSDSVYVLNQVSNSMQGYHGEKPEWGGHWNSIGHKVIGESLAKKVCAKLI
jgi:hypothetical protein